MARNGFKREFVCLKTLFLSRFLVLKVALGQCIHESEATLLIVNKMKMNALSRAHISQINVALQSLVISWLRCPRKRQAGLAVIN